MKAKHYLMLTLLISVQALARTAPQSDLCVKQGEFEYWIHLYEGCIAKRASDFEITGDAAESVAVAVLDACTDSRKNVVAFIDLCSQGQSGVGESTMKKTEKKFHDYAIRSVIEFRSARINQKDKEAKSN